jgi:hypothetical protein
MWCGGGWEKCLVAPQGFVSLTAPGKKADPCMEDGTLCSCVFFLAWAREWLSVPNFPWQLTVKGSHFLGMHTMPSEVWTRTCRRHAILLSHWLIVRPLFLKYTILGCLHRMFQLQDEMVNLNAPSNQKHYTSWNFVSYELRGRNRNSISSFSVSGSSVKH